MVRGFVREVLGVGAWVGAAVAALRFYPLVQPYGGSVLAAKNLVVYASMGVVFLVTLIVLSIVSAVIGGFVREFGPLGARSQPGRGVWRRARRRDHLPGLYCAVGWPSIRRSGRRRW